MKQFISIKNFINSAALCSVLFFVISISASYVSASTIVSLTPTDDTKVNKSSPTTNYGKSTSIEVDGGGTYEEIYMKFDLASLAGKSIVSAKLKVKVDNTSTSTQYYKLVSDTSWLETGINYNNRPAKSTTAFATGQGGPSGSTQLIDMTSTVKSILGQKFAFNIDMTASDGYGFKSKETSTTSDRPVLIVEYNDSNPTATPSKTPTPKPSETLTPTKTPTPVVPPTVVTATPGPVDAISLSPIADTYVQSDTPSTNYGTKTTLYSVGSPAKITYFKFDLSNTAGRNIVSATLYTKVQNDSTDLQTVSNVEDNSWVETAMNFSNKPALGSIIGTFTAGAINSFNASDITTSVKSHTGGLMTVAFSSAKTNNMAVYSRESADKPTLKILFALPGSPTPPVETPTPTIPDTPAPTELTPTPSDTPTAVPSNLTPTAVPCPTKSKGDANCDGNVDFIDFEIWRNEFMGEDTKTDANFNYADDQKVDFIDFEIWRQGYLEETAVTPTDTPPATPTPSTIPNDTITPTATPTSAATTLTPEPTSGITSCQWCGTSCVLADVNLRCADIAIPEGATCESVAGQCIATFP